MIEEISFHPILLIVSVSVIFLAFITFIIIAGSGCKNKQQQPYDKSSAFEFCALLLTIGVFLFGFWYAHVKNYFPLPKALSGIVIQTDASQNDMNSSLLSILFLICILVVIAGVTYILIKQAEAPGEEKDCIHAEPDSLIAGLFKIRLAYVLIVLLVLFIYIFLIYVQVSFLGNTDTVEKTQSTDELTDQLWHLINGAAHMIGYKNV